MNFELLKLYITSTVCIYRENYGEHASPIRLRTCFVSAKNAETHKPTFKYCTTYNENLSVVTQHGKEVDFCKPIYIGFTVLELSKVLMYGFHYDVMTGHPTVYVV